MGEKAQIKMSLVLIQFAQNWEWRTQCQVSGDQSLYFPGRKREKKKSICFCIGLGSFDFLAYSPESLCPHKGQFIAKLNKVESSHICPAPTQEEPPPVSISPTRVVHLLQLINLHWHIKIIQSPYFTMKFTPGVVHSSGLNKYIMPLSIIMVSYTVFLLPKGLYSIHPFPYQALLFLLSP